MVSIIYLCLKLIQFYWLQTKIVVDFIIVSACKLVLVLIIIGLIITRNLDLFL